MLIIQRQSINDIFLCGTNSARSNSNESIVWTASRCKSANDYTDESPFRDHEQVLVKIERSFFILTDSIANKKETSSPYCIPRHFGFMDAECRSDLANNDTQQLYI